MVHRGGTVGRGQNELMAIAKSLCARFLKYHSTCLQLYAVACRIVTSVVNRNVMNTIRMKRHLIA
jgi:hypothetical protein